MRPYIRRIAEAVAGYARSKAWSPNDYRLYLNLNQDWGRIHVILAARSFGCDDNHPWFSIMKFLENDFRDDPDLYDSLNLSLSFFSQIERGGLHGIPDGYEEISESIATNPAA